MRAFFEVIRVEICVNETTEPANDVRVSGGGDGAGGGGGGGLVLVVATTHSKNTNQTLATFSSGVLRYAGKNNTVANTFIDMAHYSEEDASER